MQKGFTSVEMSIGYDTLVLMVRHFMNHLDRASSNEQKHCLSAEKTVLRMVNNPRLRRLPVIPFMDLSPSTLSGLKDSDALTARFTLSDN